MNGRRNNVNPFWRKEKFCFQSLFFSLSLSLSFSLSLSLSLSLSVMILQQRAVSKKKKIERTEIIIIQTLYFCCFEKKVTRIVKDSSSGVLGSTAQKKIRISCV